MMGRKRQHPELDQLVGTDSDRALASQFGISHGTVRSRRVALGKEPSKKHRPHLTWQDSEIALMGTMTDRDLAKQIGRERGAVTAKRLSLGIPAFTPKSIALTPDQLKMIGTAADRVIAKKLGVSTSFISQKRVAMGMASAVKKSTFPKEHIPLLGTDTDRAIAEKIGYSTITVWKKRTELKIPKFQKAPKQEGTAAPCLSWGDIKQLPQGSLFAALKAMHPGLTHKQLGEMTGYSLSRIQKWMTAGTAQEPLSLSIRHHIYLAVISNHHI